MALYGTALELREFLHIVSPIFLFAIFVAAFIASSVLAAKNVGGNNHAIRTGPGGRPLPKRSRSAGMVLRLPPKYSENTLYLFKWLSVGVLLTFAADAAVNIAHVIVFRSQHWWPGQSLVVSSDPLPCPRVKWRKLMHLFRFTSLVRSSCIWSSWCRWSTRTLLRPSPNSSRGWSPHL